MIFSFLRKRDLYLKKFFNLLTHTYYKRTFYLVVNLSLEQIFFHHLTPSLRTIFKEQRVLYKTS